MSPQDSEGYITVTTPRGTIRAKTVIHATNRWTAHLLPEFAKAINGTRSTLGALKAPQGFIQKTGAQHWDGVINNYHLQLPPPYNTIILGGARAVLVHQYDECYGSGKDEEQKQFEVIPEFLATWPKRDIAEWKGGKETEFALPVDQGGIWAGCDSSSTDGFPHVGAVPSRPGTFVSTAYSGHGMPRILLASAALAPRVLEYLGIEYSVPALVRRHPKMVEQFEVSGDRIEKINGANSGALAYESRRNIDAATERAYAKPWAPKKVRARL